MPVLKHPIQHCSIRVTLDMLPSTQGAIYYNIASTSHNWLFYFVTFVKMSPLKRVIKRGNSDLTTVRYWNLVQKKVSLCLYWSSWEKPDHTSKYGLQHFILILLTMTVCSMGTLFVCVSHLSQWMMLAAECRSGQ